MEAIHKQDVKLIFLSTPTTKYTQFHNVHFRNQNLVHSWYLSKMKMQWSSYISDTDCAVVRAGGPVIITTVTPSAAASAVRE